MLLCVSFLSDIHSHSFASGFRNGRRISFAVILFYLDSLAVMALVRQTFVNQRKSNLFSVILRIGNRIIALCIYSVRNKFEFSNVE